MAVYVFCSGDFNGFLDSKVVFKLSSCKDVMPHLKMFLMVMHYKECEPHELTNARCV